VLAFLRVCSAKRVKRKCVKSALDKDTKCEPFRLSTHVFYNVRQALPIEYKFKGVLGFFGSFIVAFDLILCCLKGMDF
jgi:hypothetical protein